LLAVAAWTNPKLKAGSKNSHSTDLQRNLRPMPIQRPLQTFYLESGTAQRQGSERRRNTRYSRPTCSHWHGLKSTQGQRNNKSSPFWGRDPPRATIQALVRHHRRRAPPRNHRGTRRQRGQLQGMARSWMGNRKKSSRTRWRLIRRRHRRRRQSRLSRTTSYCTISHHKSSRSKTNYILWALMITLRANLTARHPLCLTFIRAPQKQVALAGRNCHHRPRWAMMGVWGQLMRRG